MNLARFKPPGAESENAHLAGSVFTSFLQGPVWVFIPDCSRFSKITTRRQRGGVVPGVAVRLVVILYGVFGERGGHVKGKGDGDAKGEGDRTPTHPISSAL